MDNMPLGGVGEGAILHRDTRGWYPSPHPGGQTRATVLWPLRASEGGSGVHLAQQAVGIVPSCHPLTLPASLYPKAKLAGGTQEAGCADISLPPLGHRWQHRRGGGTGTLSLTPNLGALWGPPPF